MSKTLTFVAGAGAKPAIVEAATKVLSAVGVSVKDSTVAAAKGAEVALAAGLSASEVRSLGFHSKTISTATSASLSKDATYAASNLTLVRALGPAGGAVPAVERLDKFSKAGIEVDADIAACEASFAKTAAAAVAAAGASKKVTVLQKPQSAYKQHNALFLTAVKAAAEKSEVFVDVQTSQQVVNNAVMFTETLGVVVSPDYLAGDNFEGITTGIAGGTGLASEKLQGESSTFFAQPATSGSNPTGLLLAAAGALKQLGLSAEAKKIEGAVKKASSGSTATAAFTKAVVAAL